LTYSERVSDVDVALLLLLLVLRLL